MGGVKKRTADVAAPAIQQVLLYDTCIVADNQDAVNEESVKAMQTHYRGLLERTDLTDECRQFYLGKLYRATTQLSGRYCERDDEGRFLKSHAKRHSNGRGYETADFVALEQGVGSTTVKAAGRYSKGIDAIHDMDPNLAEEILNANRKVSMKVIRSIGVADADEQWKMINSLILGKPVFTGDSIDESKKRRKEMEKIDECVSLLFGTAEHRYTMETMINDIRMNTEPIINLLTQMVRSNKNLWACNKEPLLNAIHGTVTKIEEIEEEIKNGK